MNFRSILGSALVLVSATGLLHGAEIAVPISNTSKDASTASTAAGMSGSPGFAGDGGSVFFLSDAPNLNAPARQRPVLDLYRRDLASGITERVFPRRSESDLPDGDIEAFSVSSRGDHVAAATRTGNLLPGDTNGESRTSCCATLVCRTDGETNAIWWIDVDTGIPTAISGNLLSSKAKVSDAMSYKG